MIDFLREFPVWEIYNLRLEPFDCLRYSGFGNVQEMASQMSKRFQEMLDSDSRPKLSEVNGPLITTAEFLPRYTSIDLSFEFAGSRVDGWLVAVDPNRNQAVVGYIKGGKTRTTVLSSTKEVNWRITKTQEYLDEERRLAVMGYPIAGPNAGIMASWQSEVLLAKN